MKLEAARYEHGELIFRAPPCQELYRLIRDFEAGEYELRKAKKKRSLNANAYLWVLCTQIAQKVGISKEEVYRQAIKDMGVFAPLNMPKAAIEEFKRLWTSRGIGWVVEQPDDNVVLAYYGSSTYDTLQMSRLLDYIVQDAKSIGVETLSERELSLLKEEWEPSE